MDFSRSKPWLLRENSKNSLLQIVCWISFSFIGTLIWIDFFWIWINLKYWFRKKGRIQTWYLFVLNVQSLLLWEFFNTNTLKEFSNILELLWKLWVMGMESRFYNQFWILNKELIFKEFLFNKLFIQILYNCAILSAILGSFYIFCIFWIISK